MGGGNGAKAATKRARNMKDAGPKANSILKDKEKMMNIVCTICRVRTCVCVLAWGWGWDWMPIKSPVCFVWGGRVHIIVVIITAVALPPPTTTHTRHHPQSPFMCTTKKPELETHVTNKHPKETFAKCFPMVQ